MRCGCTEPYTIGASHAIVFDFSVCTSIQRTAFQYHRRVRITMDQVPIPLFSVNFLQGVRLRMIRTLRYMINIRVPRPHICRRRLRIRQLAVPLMQDKRQEEEGTRADAADETTADRGAC